jgi:cytochrome-b5 reductase
MFRLGPRPTIFHISGLVAASSLTAFFAWYRSTSGKDHPTWPSPSQFIPAAISSIEISGPDTKRFTLTIPPHARPPTRVSLAPIWSIYIKDDQIQVERPYTPLEGIDEHGHMSFWIKKYQDGQVGRWLHSKNVGDTVEIRGPAKTWEWQSKTWDEVIMVRALPLGCGPYLRYNGYSDFRRDRHHSHVSAPVQYHHS